MKIYTLKLNYAEVKKGLKVDVTRTACMNAGDTYFTLSDIAAFLDDIRKIYRDVKRLAEVAHPIEVELTVAEYRRATGGQLQDKNFDCWTYLGTAEKEGIHLNPDTRYTNECHDIWLDFGKFDPLNDITA